MGLLGFLLTGIRAFFRLVDFVADFVPNDLGSDIDEEGPEVIFLWFERIESLEIVPAETIIHDANDSGNIITMFIQVLLPTDVARDFLHAICTKFAIEFLVLLEHPNQQGCLFGRKVLPAAKGCTGYLQRRALLVCQRETRYFFNRIVPHNLLFIILIYGAKIAHFMQLWLGRCRVPQQNKIILLAFTSGCQLKYQDVFTPNKWMAGVSQALLQAKNIQTMAYGKPWFRPLILQKPAKNVAS